MIERNIELIKRSADRLTRALALPRDKIWRTFMQRESWIHLKRSVELLWAVLRGKNGGKNGPA